MATEKNAKSEVAESLTTKVVRLETSLSELGIELRKLGGIYVKRADELAVEVADLKKRVGM